MVNIASVSKCKTTRGPGCVLPQEILKLKFWNHRKRTCIFLFTWKGALCSSLKIGAGHVFHVFPTSWCFLHHWHLQILEEVEDRSLLNYVIILYPLGSQKKSHLIAEQRLQRKQRENMNRF